MVDQSALKRMLDGKVHYFEKLLELTELQRGAIIKEDPLKLMQLTDAKNSAIGKIDNINLELRALFANEQIAGYKHAEHDEQLKALIDQIQIIETENLSNAEKLKSDIGEKRSKHKAGKKVANAYTAVKKTTGSIFFDKKK